MRFFRIVFYLLFIGLTLLNKNVIHADENSEDILDDEATVESDDKPVQAASAEEPKQDSSSALTEQDTAREEFPDGLPPPHSSVETKLLFIEPSHHGVVPRPSSIVSLEIPVGFASKAIISFRHLGLEESSKYDFTLDAVAAALRYPMDYNYYIQNFTVLRLYTKIEPNREASIYYSFNPAAQLTGRPYGLTVRLFYHDTEGRTYVSTVMNETVQLVDYEPPAGTARFIDTEAVFLYMVMVGVAGLLLVGIYHLWQSYAPRRLRATGKFAGNIGSSTIGSSGRAGKMSPGNSPTLDVNRNVIAGANNKNEELIKASAEAARAKGIDVDWIPRDVLLREAARKASPRQTKSKGADLSTSELSD